MPRNPKDKCNVPWWTRYGTASGVEGNLPEWQRTDCIGYKVDLSAVQSEFPWVSIFDFHYYHMKCPYSSEAALHYVRNLDESSPDYWKRNVPVSHVPHTTTSGMMIRRSIGSRHGWMCVDPDCPYYQGTASGSIKGRPYFQI